MEKKSVENRRVDLRFSTFVVHLHLRTRVRRARSWRCARNNRRRARHTIGAGDSGDDRVRRPGRTWRVAGAVIGVRWRRRRQHAALHNRLRWDWVLRGLADCLGDLVLLQRHGLPQHHLNGCTHVEEEVVRAGNYYQRRDQADGSSHRCPNDRAFPFIWWNTQAGRKTSGRRSRTTGGKRAGNGTVLRTGDRVSDQRTETGARRRKRDARYRAALPGSLRA